MSDYLSGYARGNPAAAADLLSIPVLDWEFAAKALLAQRRISLLNMLPDHLLQAIADRELHMVPALRAQVIKMAV